LSRAFFDENVSYKKTFEDDLTLSYHADTKRVSFGNPTNAAEEINDW
jgi:hypothetical protein